ncbi:MAG: alpha/beta hydrolase [Pyrinomonadaceae bacterium]|nr:alpha/beta hydrolase [Pyrinomonadaceae bacterium]
MKKICSWLILISFVISISAQEKASCAPDRYEKAIFSDFTKKTIEYAAAKNWSDENVSLLTDIYEPKNDDAQLRPLIIVVHGGSFTSGNKEQMTPFCTFFVKNGYVVASIQYRLAPANKVVESNNILREVVRATNDLKSAIRFFRQSAENGNPYKIDPNNIFIGGVSAGAITALQTGLLDEKDLVTDELSSIIAEEGGLNGNTGSAENRKFSTKVRGIFNLSGSIMDENWIDKDDPPIFSYHGEDDMVVPIRFKSIGTLDMYGSELIKEKADKVGLDNVLVKVPKGGHTDIYTFRFLSFFIDYANQVNQKIRSMICK